MSESIEPVTPEAVQAPVDESPRYLVGVRLREPLLTEDYQTTDPDLHVGDFVLVETGGGTVLGEVRRPKRPVPSFKLDRVYRRVVRRANGREVADWRERRALEVKGVETCARTARTRGLAMKIVDVEMDPSRRRVTVFFNSEERVDFRDLVRDLAHEFHARIEMRQIGARDTTKLMDGIGPCGRQRFEQRNRLRGNTVPEDANVPIRPKETDELLLILGRHVERDLLSHDPSRPIRIGP